MLPGEFLKEAESGIPLLFLGNIRTACHCVEERPVPPLCYTEGKKVSKREAK